MLGVVEHQQRVLSREPLAEAIEQAPILPLGDAERLRDDRQDARGVV